MRATIIYILLILSFIACKQEKTSSNKLYIITTTGMIGDAVMNVTGDSATVISLMGPGVDPHLYKATQGDLSKLTNADVVFYNGLHLEGKMGEVLESLGHSKSVVPISKDIPKERLRKVAAFNNNYDPHIWFDVALWKIAVSTINEYLGIEYPHLKNHFSKNTNKYLQRLDSLEVWISEQVNIIPENQRVLITAHDAFGYFGQAYGMEVKGLQGISTLSEFGLRDITELVTFISEKRIKAVFIETSVSERAINAVVEGCSERGFEINIGGSLYSDAMGDPNTGEGDYIGMFQANVTKIVNALK